MQKMKNSKGVTLIVLVITIIVLLIIAGISINLGIDSLDDSVDKKLKSELILVQQACIVEYTKAKQLGYLENITVKPDNFIGTEISISDLPDFENNSDEWLLEEEPSEKYKEYFELDPEDLDKLGILDSEYTYIVNYYTGEVYNKTIKVSSEGENLYIKSTATHQTNENEDDTNFVVDNW